MNAISTIFFLIVLSTCNGKSILKRKCAEDTIDFATKVENSSIVVYGKAIEKVLEEESGSTFRVIFRVDCILKGPPIAKYINITRAGRAEGKIYCQNFPSALDQTVAFLELDSSSDSKTFIPSDFAEIVFEDDSINEELVNTCNLQQSVPLDSSLSITDVCPSVSTGPQCIQTTIKTSMDLISIGSDLSPTVIPGGSQYEIDTIRSIADDPQITSCCNRVFCAKDADLNQYTNGCPLCRKKHFAFKSSPKHKEMLEQLTIKCVCSEHIAPDEYERHLERCSNVTLTCPHNTCREKNDLTKYNSQELVSHLARYHCNEVSLLGSTFINKKSVESYKKASIKYHDLVSTLYSVLYPKMIDIQLKNCSSTVRNSSIFKCPHGHKLIEADNTKRKRKNGSVYSSSSYNCDICHHSFADGQSWHCSCTDTGFDKCVACLVFQLYNIDNNVLKLASQDKEKQQEHYRRGSIRNIVHLPRGIFRLLTGNMGENEDNNDSSLLPLRNRAPFSNEQHISERRENNRNEDNHHED
ncbi:unnamed protein product [Rotaria sp. Silwood2]|nr:unnamed protein product [Rotaria sp. Silwood2]CAF2563594.1 unnamed protein product [Rotaria sp. Silwood2]CAF2968184.1 unnamed protein product [Rotaria sp. Silwood2]CAF3903930.1 unnamed protein product [Rotaria sp. Silwood2]CAF4098927.1 unnamed protein product [Rotaria sp. Silwood2]